MTSLPRPLRPNPTILIATVATTVVVSLTIHVVMLQVLWVPYPDPSGVGRLGLLYPLAQALGIVALAAAALPWLRRFHPAMRGPIVGLIYGGMNGIIRNAMMAGFATTDFGGSVAGFVQQALFDLILGTLAVGAVSLIHHVALRIVAGIALFAAGTFLLNPALASVLAPLIAWSAEHTQADVYQMPYGANILIPSYILFAETVIACLVVRYIITLREVAWDRTGLLRYVGLVLLVRGVWVMTFVWGPIIGILSVSQFFLQDLVMALMIHAAWRRFGRDWPIGGKSSGVTRVGR